MRKLVRTAIAVVAVSTPVAIGAVNAPAEATCRPEKPATCPCPVGFDRVGPFCLPTGLLDGIATP